MTMQPWSVRSTAPGVIRAHNFNSIADLGVFNPPSFGDYGYIRASSPGGTTPSLEPTIRCGSGAFSVRMRYPAGLIGTDCAGEFYWNMSSDFQTRRGENTTFWAQCRSYWDTGMLDVVRATTGGVKIFDVVPQSTSNFSQGIINSSDDGKIVVTTYGQGFQFPHAYRYWGSGNSFGTYGLYSGGGIFQNGSGIPGSCQYSPFTPANIAGCFVVPPNEWLTWTMRIKLGALGIFTDGVGASAQSWLNSEVQLYVQRNGQSRIQLLDWNPATPDYRPLLASHDYGQMTLFPYTTTPTDGSQIEGNVYYDELIFSDNDPGEATPANVGAAATRIDRSRVSIG